MSGIARMLVSRGDEVSGSDLVSNNQTQELKKLGVVIQSGHTTEWIEKSDFIVRSSAIQEDNPELIAARASGKPILERAEMLAKIMERFNRIVIAGSHGKTTTSSLATDLLNKAGLNPSFVVGGILHEQGTNACLTDGEHIVVEADESDASFLMFNPHVAIITNIDSDHLSTYNDNIDELEQAFIKFTNKVEENGVVIACIDDPRLSKILSSVNRRVITYSTQGKPADYQANITKISDGKSYFQVQTFAGNKFDLVLSMPGEHNVSNALACVALADCLEIPHDKVQEIMQTFRGVGRRFDTYHFNKTIVVDDYGHHPQEIEVTLKAARENWPDKKICLVFQPHRYTRTKQLFEEFVVVLQHTHQLILMDIYTANEHPIEGADSDALAATIHAKTGATIERIKDCDELLAFAKSNFGKDEVVILQGAGSIGGMVKPFLEVARDL